MTSSQAKSRDKTPAQFNLKGPKKFFDDLDLLQEELGVTSRTEVIKLAVKELSHNVRVRSEKVVKEVGLRAISFEHSREWRQWTAHAFATSNRAALIVNDLSFLSDPATIKLFKQRLTSGKVTQFFIPHHARPDRAASYLSETVEIIKQACDGNWDAIRASNTGGLEILGYSTQPAFTGFWTESDCAICHRNGVGETFCKMVFFYDKRATTGTGYHELMRTLTLLRQHCLKQPNSDFLELARSKKADAPKRPRKR